MPYLKTSIGATPEWVDELPVKEDNAVSIPVEKKVDMSPVVDEQMASFCAAHYGSDGLNGRFNRPDSLEFFAGGASGGGGKFEDPTMRELATQRFHTDVQNLMCKMIDMKGASIIDVGAGTGLFLNLFSSMVGDTGNVFAIDITPSFVTFMRERVQKEHLQDSVHVSLCTSKETLLSKKENNLADAAFICDVYHHFEYPKTFMKDLRDNLKTNGMVFLVDFYRQPSKMISHEPQWALDHIRADRETFLKEVEDSGFVSCLCVGDIYRQNS
jgi:2-polyprenyl-3-methyl-5-hydroxy-6-metoxy-1,4-benzoquinol methylase